MSGFLHARGARSVLLALLAVLVLPGGTAGAAPVSEPAHSDTYGESTDDGGTTAEPDSPAPVQEQPDEPTDPPADSPPPSDEPTDPQPPPAEEPAPPQSPDCHQDGSQLTVTFTDYMRWVFIEPKADGAIWVNGAQCSGTATVANVDSILVTDTGTSTERVGVTLDLSHAPLGPGLTEETSGTSEIEMTIDADGAPWDIFAVVGTAGADHFVSGEAGLNLNGDDDVDVSAPAIEQAHFYGRGGADVLSFAGGFGTSATSAVTGLLDGEDGNDVLTGNDQWNHLIGGPGNDYLEGRGGDDGQWAGDGDDYYYESSVSNGADDLHGGNGFDTIDYSDRTEAVSISDDGLANDGASGESDNARSMENVLEAGKQSVNTILTDAGTVSTGSEVTPEDPVATSVTIPSGGTVTITESTPVAGSEPTGYEFLGQQVEIHTDAESTWDNPLVLGFLLDASTVPEGEDAGTLVVFRNGEALPDCLGSSVALAPTAEDPDGSACVSGRSTTPEGDVMLTIVTPGASVWNLGIRTVTFDSLCTQTLEYLGPNRKAKELGASLCAQLRAAEGARTSSAKLKILKAYEYQVKASAPRFFTSAQAGTLIALARELATT